MTTPPSQEAAGASLVRPEMSARQRLVETPSAPESSIGKARCMVALGPVEGVHFNLRR